MAYLEPNIEIFSFNVLDIITASNPLDEDELPSVIRSISKNVPVQLIPAQARLPCVGVHCTTENLRFRRIFVVTRLASGLAMGGMPPKSLQKLMEHANFAISMDVYTDLEFSAIRRDFSQAAYAL